MKQKILNLIQELNHKKIIIAIAIIIVTVMLLTIAVYSNKKSSNDDYILSLINWIKEHNQKIPEFEKNLRILKLKKRCLNAQIERIKNNEDYDLNYCDDEKNLEQFSELQKKDETKPVSSLVPKIEVKEQKKEVVKNVATQKKLDVEKEAFKFISSFEWLHLSAYWDYKQYSIWYWSKSYKGEQITKEEAEKRLIQKIKDIRNKHKLEKYNDWLEVALISFVYNTGHLPKWLNRYVDNNYIWALKSHMKAYVYAWGIKLNWLIKRRNAEVSLF